MILLPEVRQQIGNASSCRWGLGSFRIGRKRRLSRGNSHSEGADQELHQLGKNCNWRFLAFEGGTGDSLTLFDVEAHFEAKATGMCDIREIKRKEILVRDFVGLRVYVELLALIFSRFFDSGICVRWWLQCFLCDFYVQMEWKGDIAVSDVTLISWNQLKTETGWNPREMFIFQSKFICKHDSWTAMVFRNILWNNIICSLHDFLQISS